MSGVGEVIAIVGCVAGLIQALDAGQRIVKQIKDRRQAHRSLGALPPSDLLEQTLEHGKQEIEQLVEKGKQRFGPEFEEADETARMAIMQITIQIQNALLQRLTQARSDDGVIDFDECIDLSDQGCNDALVALRALYQRKLKEDMGKKQKKEPQTTCLEIIDKTPATTPPRTQPIPSRAKDTEANTSKPRISKEEHPPPRLETTKKPKTISLNLFRKSVSEATQEPNRAPQAIERCDTSLTTTSASLRRGTVHSDRSSISKTSRPTSLYSDGSHTNSAVSPSVEASEMSWTRGMSRASTIATAASVVSQTPTLTQYSGTCKYAYMARETGPDAGLVPVNLSMYTKNWVYKCKSSKCQYQTRAISDKKGLKLDNQIYRSHGVQYRCKFLVKSHVAHKETTSEWPYICLFCLFLRHQSDIYYTADDLMRHISTHEERTIGRKDIPMEGPLSFNNMDVDINDDFDVQLPELSSPSSPTNPEHSPAQVFEELKKSLSPMSVSTEIKTSERVLSRVDEIRAHSDPYDNPWA